MIEDTAPRGMILAAGYGTRLAPLTDHLSKPLLPVPGGTVLDRAIAALDRAGVGEIAVNTHHLADRVADHLADRPDRDRFRVSHETNRYSVPAEYASTALTLKVYQDRLCVYHQHKLIARHVRCYDRHQDIEHPDHPRALLAQRRNAREQKLLGRFLTFSPKAEAYYQALAQKRLNPRHHVQKIVALSEIYGTEAVARAMEDAFTFQAFSCEYIANLLESRQRLLPEPGALHLTRRQDLLDLDMPEPDLSAYEPDLEDTQ